jgi:hypothetical protein
MPAGRVDGELPPVVGAADSGARIVRPRVGAELAGSGDGPEGPDERARSHVEGADVARRRRVFAVGRRAHDDQVFEHLAWQPALLLDRLGIAIEAQPQVDATVDAKRQDRLAGSRVEGLQHVSSTEQQAAIGAVGALPVVHASKRETPDAIVHPELLAGGRVERHQPGAPGSTVDDTARDERVEVGVARRVGPGTVRRPTLVLSIAVAATKRELSGPPA